MDLKFEKRYDKKVEKINLLREQLSKETYNKELINAIEEEERKLFEFVQQSGKELETFLQSEAFDYDAE